VGKIICHITSVHKAGDIHIFQKECTSLAKAGFDVKLLAANAESAVLNGVDIIGVKSAAQGRTC